MVGCLAQARCAVGEVWRGARPRIDAFGGRFDLALLERRGELGEEPPRLTVKGDWAPLWRRALDGKLNGGEVAEKRPRAAARTAPRPPTTPDSFSGPRPKDGPTRDMELEEFDPASNPG